MLFTRNCGLRFTNVITVLSIFTALASSQKLDFTNLTLIETSYNTAIASLESDTVSTKYTLSELLSNVVPKSGFSTTNTVEEEKNLRYYQTGFRWDLDEEANSTNWEPTGLSTWQDTVPKVNDATLASVQDSWKGVAVVSWKDTATKNNAGVRVTFVVNGTEIEGSSRKYVHVLLVDNVAKKKGGGMSFDVIDPQNIGGMVWHGGWLFIGDGMNGLRAFDVSHIWKVDAESAFGMEYILPQARMYNPSGFPASYRSFTFDFLSIDRNSTPPCLLVGEYEDNNNMYTYLAKWPLDGTTGRLATEKVNGQLVAFANWGYKISILRVRGMIWAHDKFFIARLAAKSTKDTSGDLEEQGELYIWSPGQKYLDPISGVLPRGVGGLAYSPDGDEMWAVGVPEGSRGVVGIKAGGYMGEDVPPVPNPTTPKQTKSGDSVPTPTSGSSNDDSSDGTAVEKPTKTNTGAIAGGVIGGLLAGALLLWLFIMYRRRRAAQSATRPLTSRGVDQYPPPGFIQGTDEYYHGHHKGEIPMLKCELDASSTQVNQEGYAAAVARSTGSKEHFEDLRDWENQKAGVRMPARKPVPLATPAMYNHGGGMSEGPFIELPAAEKPVEAP